MPTPKKPISSSDPTPKKKATKKAAPKKATAKKAVTKKPATKKVSKKITPSKLAPPPPDRLVKVIKTTQLGVHIPTAPKKHKPQYASFRSSRKSLVNPRRVRGGVKLKNTTSDGVQNWVTQRIMRVAEAGAAPDHYRDGMEYATLGQTKRLTIEETLCEGIIQGRSDKPYTTTLRFVPFTLESQDEIIVAMSEQVRYAAKLLAGELPSNIEDVFAPLGIKLFPSECDEIDPECSCPDWSEEKKWCKHAVCLAALLAEKLADDPMLIFGLHNMPGSELIEGLRQHRTVGAQGPGPAPVLVAHVPGVSDVSSPPLEDVL
ncbi:MAG: SWIM zinc finger family protein, partial [Phycisphaerales bacterium]|nr:SWIM zinc finger family protein [Phycisphaerales bacterium]